MLLLNEDMVEARKIVEEVKNSIRVISTKLKIKRFND
jgi:hypothetical protein